ncbi:DUF2946 family protein [Achromobacter ruhlandii]|uniref:DUF2946 family protein n=1 Tax=Achromobacter ruhlandii TaxID=72557 RepID=UPI002DC000B8|nr:DUF2946 family protein [Achromobacter ruhlandii]MEB6660308.1 DUF2946 family protein [Achromobacter ruhlandii]
MSALIRPPRPRDAVRVRGVLWLAFLALLLRAVVPAGYMPDTRALHDGRIEVTFCSAAGDLSTLRLALAPAGKGDAGAGKGDAGAGAHSNADTGAQCPFGLLAHVTPASASPTTPLALASGRPAPAASAPLALPVQPAQGPPLGSRAPPRLA